LILLLKKWSNTRIFKAQKQQNQASDFSSA